MSFLSIQEPSCSTSTEPRPLSKAPQGSQALRPSQGSKSSSLDALGPAAWKEEEASFWKINAERSRGEGPEAEFQSLTPSQIKSMEKGEKVLPVCYRQEPAPKAREAKVEKSSSLRQEQGVLPSVSVERERPQPAQACSSPLSEAAASEPVGDTEGALFSEPVPVQVGALLPARGSFLPSDQGHLTWVGGPQMPPFSPSSAIPQRTSGFRSAGLSLSLATSTQAGDVFCEAVWCRDLFACSVVVSQMPTALPQLCEGRYGRDAGGSEQRTRGGRRQCGWDAGAWEAGLQCR